MTTSSKVCSHKIFPSAPPTTKTSRRNLREQGEKDVNDDHRQKITDFIQSIPEFQECDEEDVETWMACDAEDCGFQMPNDDEIVTSNEEESDPVGDETDDDKDNHNNESSKGLSNADTRFLRWRQLWSGTNNNQSAIVAAIRDISRSCLDPNDFTVLNCIVKGHASLSLLAEQKPKKKNKTIKKQIHKVEEKFS
ncbi:hypothetical protein TNCV_2483821 [Trichonephila clavipes]|uniref:Uncharacterized protein n=1 Tax=Trichonephila clavipes TaxID=2585209 RepID=A0A8X7BC85_TRICX|nr:hypothetical protein TNCV_2483821 [Trichonephila clavipes]